MKHILSKLQDKQSFSQEEASIILRSISEGDFTDSQVAALLISINMRGVTLAELKGFRDVMLENAIPFQTDFDTTDLCGTGGDGKNTFNISTLASFVVAGAGVKVTKHGNYGVSSACGSSNVLEALGASFTKDESRLKQQLEQSNICFLHAPLFHPAMKNVANIRRELGVKTFFNLLGPISNPARPKYQLIGVFSHEVYMLYKFLFQSENQKIALVHSEDGYDEISLTSNFKISINDQESFLHPRDIALDKLNQTDIFGGNTVDESKNIFVDVLSGNGNAAQENVVCINAGAAISNFYSTSLEEGFEQAKESLKSRKALESLNKFITLSN